ncbi:MAG: hypothetical protein DRP26_01870 [Candidatus Zixiibacteriota bacterium]|nr:MAG: hypothetical protein DRP26_01870 [candidate division Zixibacteria bacterium]
MKYVFKPSLASWFYDIHNEGMPKCHRGLIRPKFNYTLGFPSVHLVDELLVWQTILNFKQFKRYRIIGYGK